MKHHITTAKTSNKKRFLCSAIILALSFVSTAQNFFSDEYVSPEMRIMEYSENLVYYCKYPSMNDNSDIRRHIYSNFYLYSQDNPSIIKFRFVYPDIDSFDIRKLPQTEKNEIKSYLDEIWHLHIQQGLTIQAIDYTIVDTNFYTDDSASFITKKDVKMSDNGEHVEYTIFEKIHLMFNKQFNQWEILSISLAKDYVYIEKEMPETPSPKNRNELSVNITDESSTELSNVVQSYIIGNVTFTMVYVEGGSFTMGCTGKQNAECSDDEKPAHNVTLSSYYIGETEVTQALWNAVMGENPSFFKGDNLPVENISYNDAKTFIKKLNQQTGKNFRLPTEAEWEYAARGGNKSRGYMYSGSNDISSVAWYDENSGSKTHFTKSKKPNELGIYDMSGNVWEWCDDYYAPYSKAAMKDPTGSTEGSSHVTRGGSWVGSASGCRMSFRGNIEPTYHISILGMRLAITP